MEQEKLVFSIEIVQDKTTEEDIDLMRKLRDLIASNQTVEISEIGIRLVSREKWQS